jgi:predicted Zn-dependent peptidase
MNEPGGLRPLLDLTLSNRLRLVVVRDTTAPLVEIRLSIPCAEAGEPRAAAAAVLSEVLLRPPAEAAPERADAWAVTELASARDVNRLGVFGFTPAECLEPALAELADCLATPRYTEEAVVEAGQRVGAQMTVARGEARWIALAALLRRRYPAEAVPCDLPSPQSLAAVTPAAVRALHLSRVTPRGSTLVLVGDVPPTGVAAMAERTFGVWRGGPRQGRQAPGTRPPGGELALVHRPNSAQSELLLAGPALDRTHPMRPALDVACTVFGGGVASRLTRNVREDKGYAYLAASALEVVAGRPTVVVRLAASERSTAAVLAETRRELLAMTQSPPDRAEIAAAVRLLAGGVTTSHASPASTATFLANLLADGADPRWITDFPARLAALSVEVVADAARAHLSPDLLETVVVGDADAVACPLAELPGMRVRRYPGLDEVSCARSPLPARRYRTLPADLGTVPSVAPFLDRLGLGAFDPADLVSHAGRNENWAGRTSTGQSVFVKHLGGEGEDVRRRLLAIRVFEELLAEATGTALRGPRCLGWSEQDALVAFELLPDARTGAERADDGAFDEKDAHRTGEMIGVLHGLDPAAQAPLDTSAPPLPPVAALSALTLERHRTASAAELRVWAILQHDDELASAIRRLRRQSATAPTGPAHCDLRLDQVLFVQDTAYLLDAEELRRADPARDLGTYVGEWLYRAVRALPGAAGTTPLQDAPAPSDEETRSRGVRELARLRPLLEAFCAGYRSTGRPLEGALRVRAAGFAGWHLIDRVMAQAAQHPELSAVDRAALGIARTVLLSPAAVTATLGLEN